MFNFFFIPGVLSLVGASLFFSFLFFFLFCLFLFLAILLIIVDLPLPNIDFHHQPQKSIPLKQIYNIWKKFHHQPQKSIPLKPIYKIWKRIVVISTFTCGEKVLPSPKHLSLPPCSPIPPLQLLIHVSHSGRRSPSQPLTHDAVQG